jgi:hypothetical protein
VTPTRKQDNHDEADVERALKRETADGPGFDNEDDLPESDFESFAEDGVENDHDGNNVTVESEEEDSK